MTRDREDHEAPHADLIDRLAALDEVKPAAGWEERAMARWEETRRARPAAAAAPARPWGWFAAGLAVAAVAVVLLVGRCGTRTPPPGALAVAVNRTHSSNRAVAYAIGDRVSATWPRRGPHRALRVYRNGRLWLNCPGDVLCVDDPGTVGLEIAFDAPGRYDVVGFAAKGALPAAGDAGLDLDLAAARDAGAEIARWPTVEVR